MTEPIEGQEQEIVFSDEQQKFLDKLIGKARTKARELAKTEFETAAKDATADAEREQLAAAAEWQKLADMHADRVTELEPFEAEAKAYRELIAGMLKDKVKALGDAAKKAVKALPNGLSDLDRLNWLNANQALFETDTPRKFGTPAAKVKKAVGKSGRPEGYVPSRL
jgi:DNA repair ATPase RecN